MQLQCVSTETKGRGMVSLTDVPQATLLHTEEPYFAILFHAHHVQWLHIALSFAKHMLEGKNYNMTQKNHEIGLELSTDLEKYVATVTKSTVNDENIKQNAKHRHACGVNWPAALPAKIVLAGQVIVKSTEQHGKFGQ
nr:hypothetical protein [Tanacetum cinerariifolium]